MSFPVTRICPVPGALFIISAPFIPVPVPARPGGVRVRSVGGDGPGAGPRVRAALQPERGVQVLQGAHVRVGKGIRDRTDVCR